MQENQQMREAELAKLLEGLSPDVEVDLDVPSFLRNQSGGRNGGTFR